MTLTNELLVKSLNALKEANLQKSLRFKKTGKEIKEGIAKRIAECQAKITVLKEMPVPAKVDEGKEISDVPVGATPETSESPNKWRIESLERRIKDYETISRNLKDNQTYEIDKWELTEYGL